MFNVFKIASFFGALMIVMPPSEAAIINHDFNVTIDSGLLTGEVYNGSFAYDDATLTNLGLESIGLSSITFSFSSAYYDLSDAGFGATADFLDGLFLGINYSVNGSNAPFFYFVPALGTFLPYDVPYFAYQTVPGGSGFGSFNLTSVPLPGALWLFGSSMVGLLSVTRRRKI
jgi:hypothetical protein